MYSIKPHIDWNGGVDMSTCMYHMKPLYTLNHANATTNKATAVSNSLVGTKNDLKNSDSVCEMLSKRQDQLLHRLNHLKCEIDKLLAQSDGAVKPSLSGGKIEVKKSQSLTQQPAVPKKVLVQNRITDIVINAHPSQLPTSLFIIRSFLSHHFPVLVSSIVHCSAKDIISPKVKNYLDSNGPLCPDRNFYKYGLTFIWKKEKNLPSMIVSPAQHVPVIGEYSIARYLDRMRPSGGYESFGNVASAIADKFIDDAATFRKTGSPDLPSIIERMEKQLSNKHKFLLADVVTLVDIIMWSLLFSSKGVKEKLMNNTKRWFDQCSMLAEFQNVI